MKHNNYQDGKFQNIEFSDGDMDASVGVMEAGSYNFTTEREEKVKCLTGSIIVNGEKYLPGQEVIINRGESFEISSEEVSSYLCIYN